MQNKIFNIHTYYIYEDNIFIYMNVNIAYIYIYIYFNCFEKEK